jgi:hypothetical protein
MTNPDEDAIMAQADKDLEERANRAKEILSMRYKSLRQDQVRRQHFSCSICKSNSFDFVEWHR